MNNNLLNILRKHQSGYSYGWLDVVYLEWLGNRKPSKENFKQFYLELLRLKREGKIELACAGGTIRRLLAKRRGLLALNRKMEEWMKRMLHEGEISQAFWMYRVEE
jgi:hypothetical protein